MRVAWRRRGLAEVSERCGIAADTADRLGAGNCGTVLLERRFGPGAVADAQPDPRIVAGGMDDLLGLRDPGRGWRKLDDNEDGRRQPPPNSGGLGVSAIRRPVLVDARPGSGSERTPRDESRLAPEHGQRSRAGIRWSCGWRRPGVESAMTTPRPSQRRLYPGRSGALVLMSEHNGCCRTAGESPAGGV